MSAKAAAPIGMLGGSFDPIHAGHLQLARDAQQSLGLASLVFFPAGRPWQKGSLTRAADRVRMLELALQGHPQWRIDTREIERGGPSYTIDTLREVRGESPPGQPLVWIMGYDQLRRLATWHRWEELSAFAHIAYAQRAGAATGLDAVMRHYIERHRGEAGDLLHRAAGTCREFPMRAVDCSATSIRAALATGDEALAARYLPAPVLEYIRCHQLYATDHGH